MTDWEFRLLGPFEVLHQGVRVGLNSARQRTLLATLVLAANKPVTVERLIAGLWGQDAPSGARNSVQNYVLRLRRVLEAAGGRCPLTTSAAGYCLRVDDQSVDVNRFVALVRRAGETPRDQERVSALLTDALALWRGQPLPDVPGEALHRDVVPALAEQRLNALEQRIDADLGLGRHGEILAELAELTGAHPLRERFWAQRMLALYRTQRQGEALACYREASTVLAEELGIDPGPQLRELHRAVLARDRMLTPPTRIGAPSRARTLPAEVAGIIGRDELVTRTRRLLNTARLVTLSGPFGVGKSRLALRAATLVADEFPDGAELVDLATVTGADQLAATVADAVGGPSGASAAVCRRALAEHLRARRMLLVLDNCEHLVEAVSELARVLLSVAPHLRILVTSRHELTLAGEHVIPVPPLAVAEGGADERPAAVQLLIDRAVVAPDLRPSLAFDGVAGLLCRRLDGIPLAIELAAAQLRTLSVDEVLGRVDDRFRLLRSPGVLGTGPAYHASLRAAVDRSHELCDADERLLWARLSLLPRRFGLSAIESVCAARDLDGQDVVEVFARLVRKSVVHVDERANRKSFRLLDTVRDYGHDRLIELEPGREPEALPTNVVRIIRDGEPKARSLAEKA